MAVIERSNVIDGVMPVFERAGVPVAGTNEVQTVTIGGTPTGGTFKIALGAMITASITWSSTNATLLGNINTALDAVFGTASIVATDSTLTAGIGNFLLTFSGNEYAKSVQPLVTLTNSLTGTAPTLARAETTPGVDAAPYRVPAAGLVSDTTNKKLYINTGTVYAPTWTVVGAQT